MLIISVSKRCHQHFDRQHPSLTSMWLMSYFILREMKVNEKIWKGIDEGIYKQDSEEMTLAWQEAITEASKESLKDYLINELSEVHLSKDAVVRLFPIVDYF